VDIPFYRTTKGNGKSDVDKIVPKILNNYYNFLNEKLKKRPLRHLKEYLFMPYEKLFDDIFKRLSVFLSNIEVKNEQHADMLKRKFITGIMKGGVLPKGRTKGDDLVLLSLYEISHVDNDSNDLFMTKAPVMAMNFILAELSKDLGMSYKEFMKLTIMESDLLLDIIDLKTNITQKISEEIEKENNKDNETENLNNPFLL
jgi:hypothetical protein